MHHITKKDIEHTLDSEMKMISYLINRYNIEMNAGIIFLSENEEHMKEIADYFRISDIVKKIDEYHYLFVLQYTSHENARRAAFKVMNHFHRYQPKIVITGIYKDDTTEKVSTRLFNFYKKVKEDDSYAGLIDDLDTIH